MKAIELLVEYEKLFPHEYFDFEKYKRVIKDGFLDKPTNKCFKDENKLREHLLRFSLLIKFTENNEEVERVKHMGLRDIEAELVKFGVVYSRNKVYFR